MTASFLKTPITYYGGKQRLLRHILPLIPKHSMYTEVFVGGGALFWAKEKSPIEVINDKDGEIINFYQVVQSNMSEFLVLTNETLHCRSQYQFALIVHSYPDFFSSVRRAWAIWVLANQCFSAHIGAGWSFSRTAASGGRDICVGKTMSKKVRLSIEVEEGVNAFAKRLEGVQLECRDALTVLKSRDNKDAFHYIDPPYLEANQGHYAGYTSEHFRNLLETLDSLKGKWLLSHYPNDILIEWIKERGLSTRKIEQMLCAGKADLGGKRKRKVELLVANYDIGQS